MKAYSYVRFSTPEQAKGNSLKRQTEAAEEYAKEHGFELDVSLRDLGISAYSGSNRSEGAFGRFLAAVEDGRVPRGSTLIVESLDRISREDVLSAQAQLIHLLQAGIIIVTLIDRQTYSLESVKSEWWRLLISLATMARAHDESAHKADRVATAWKAKRKRAVTGEAQTSRCVAWVRLEGSPKGGARHVLIPERVAVLVTIFELTAAGYGQRQIAKRLNTQRLPAWGRGNGWQASYIAKLLEGRSVLGFYQPHTKPSSAKVRTPSGPEIAGYYPAAIPEDLYYRALAARTGRKTSGGAKGKGVSNLFLGLGKCANCGGSMLHLNKGDTTKGGRWLMCDSTVRGLPCEEPARWRYLKAERAILTGIRKLDVAAVLGQADPATAAQARATALAGQLAGEERKRDRLLAAFGDMDDPALAARVRDAAEHVARLRKEAAEAEKAAGVAVHSAGGLADRVAMVGQLADRLATLEGQELADIRTALAQELRRVLVRLRFTPFNILADYRLDGPTSRLAWTKGVPLLQSADDVDHFAEQDEINTVLEGVPRMREHRLPPPGKPR